MTNFSKFIKILKQKVESNSPGNIMQGGRQARSRSYMQIEKGKETIGSEYSTNSAFKIDPRKELDINMYLQKLNDEYLKKIDKYAEKNNVTIQSIVKLAIDKNLKPESLVKLLEK